MKLFHSVVPSYLVMIWTGAIILLKLRYTAIVLEIMFGKARYVITKSTRVSEQGVLGYGTPL